MRMKKLVSILALSAMVLTLFPMSAFAADESTEEPSYSISNYTKAEISTKTTSLTVTREENDTDYDAVAATIPKFDSFADLWKGINEGFYYIANGGEGTLLVPEDELPDDYTIDKGEGDLAFTEGDVDYYVYPLESVYPKTEALTIHLGDKVATRAADVNTFTMDQAMEIDRNLVIKYGAWVKEGTTYDVSLSFTSDITIKDGGSLTFVNNSSGSTLKPAGKISFAKPIKVEEGGTLDLGAFVTSEDQYTTYTYTGTSGSMIDAAAGSNVDISAVKLKSATSTDPVITTAGTLNLVPREEGSKYYRAVIESPGTAVAAKTGSTVKLDKIDVTSTGDDPAVSVEEGATLEIPTDSTAKITATNDNAVSFAKNATAKLGDQTVKAGEQGATMDNSGNLLASAGSTLGDGAPSAGPMLLTNTGKTYSAPAGTEITKNDDGSYDLPEDTVTGDGDKLIGGGTVGSDDGTLTENAKTISLDRDSVSLYHNTDNNTVQLTATVDPDTIPVTWSSSDTSVASVSDNGLVTAHKDGTAVITATAGDKTVTCTVNVSTYVYTGKYSYEVFTSVGAGGTISVDRYATEGDKVTIDVAPDEAYLLDELVVTANGKEVELTDNGDGTYTFTMPSADVRISATFAEDPDWTEPEPEPEPEPSTDVSDIFIDVAPNAWYKDAVQYAYDNGLMTGVSANEFAPDATTTRGMIVSMLARLEGVESANDAGFADVSDEWYATAVNWAASVGVVNGYEDNTFRPNDAITREQLAAILMNYSAYKGEDVSARADLSAYTDQPSAWAEETMSWAVAEGLITGVTADTLQPQGAATRAQVAAILQRFLSE